MKSKQPSYAKIMAEGGLIKRGEITIGRWARAMVCEYPKEKVIIFEVGKTLA